MVRFPYYHVPYVVYHRSFFGDKRLRMMAIQVTGTLRKTKAEKNGELLRF
jgi:hypothetical protein